MDLGLRNRRAAVAASTAGLGLATARALLDEGARVAICGRDPERLAAAAADLGPDVVAILADVGAERGATDFVTEAAARLGGLDILVANAGGPPSATATGTSVEQYRAAIELNLLSTVAMALTAVPAMREQGWGRILAITSIGVRQPIPFLAASVTARAGVTGFLKSLATEVAPDGVTVNSIQPGSHLTDRLRNLHDGQMDALRADIPVGEVGDPADFGAAAAFLCSEQARFITGTSLLVDGGASRGLL
jgi:3-oxoacyl-[acyl-carrier protein] reductase